MATLDPSHHYLVLINTFQIDPSRSEALFEVLSVATEQVIRHQPGFVSANLHVSADRRHIANYAQWADLESLQAMMSDPIAQVHMKHAASIADAFEPIYYALRESTQAGAAQ